MKRRFGGAFGDDSVDKGKESAKRRPLKRQRGQRGQKNDVDPASWVSASAIANYMLNDPIVDWLKQRRFWRGARSSAGAQADTASASASSQSYLMQQGIAFEKKVMEHIKATLGESAVATVCGDSNDIYKREKFAETIELMKKGVPVIYQGVLHNASDKTYGSPDMLVRSDRLEDIVGYDPMPEEIKHVASPRLNRRYHYVIVDIKFMTMQMCADGQHLVNSNRNPCIKGQLIIYNRALGKVQGYTPEQCYVLGRGYTYTSKGEQRKSGLCDMRLGVITPGDRDAPMLEKTMCAIEWVKEVREDGSRWVATPEPTRYELRPNMKNKYDTEYRQEKKEIADATGEITSMWFCGVRERDKFLSKGISAWTDPRCMMGEIGVRGVRGPTMDKMLRYNRGEICMGEQVIPKKITIEYFNWKREDELEFFIDFEATGGIVEDFGVFPDSKRDNTVFMVGLGFVIKGRFNYKCFAAKKLTDKGEKKMFAKFHDFVGKLSKKCRVDDPKFYHWSAAETRLYDEVVRKNPGVAWKRPRFCDFLTVMQDEPVLVRGVMGFGVKAVGKALYEQGLIAETWEKSDCNSGIDAMFQAAECYGKAKEQKKPVKKMQQFKDIIRYNYSDCKVMREIIEYLRKNHV